MPASFKKSRTLIVARRFVNAIPSPIPSGSSERHLRYRHNFNAAQRSSCPKALAIRAISARLQPTSSATDCVPADASGAMCQRPRPGALLLCRLIRVASNISSPVSGIATFIKRSDRACAASALTAQYPPDPKANSFSAIIAGYHRRLRAEHLGRLRFFRPL